MSEADSITIYEVGPRDGLQNEAETISTDIKVALIEMLADAGLKHIESTAFVSPKWVPQMGDHNEVMRSITRKQGVHYPVLVPNEKGLDAAINSGVEDIAVFAAASETFSRKNINCSIAESLERFAPVLKKAKDHNISVRGYVSCVAGCPYEGYVKPSKVAEISSWLYDMGCAEISLGDTIGTGTPNVIQEVICETMQRVPIEKLALHCHDTYGQAIANIYAGVEMGIKTIDSSVGGLGGCPYAKGASGNVATEDVLYLLHGLGLKTGVDIDGVVKAACFIADTLGRKPSSHVALARHEDGCR